MAELTVHYILESPLDRRDYERFGVAVMKERYKVRIWDISPFLSPTLYKLALKNQNLFSPDECTLIQTEAQAIEEISRLTQSDRVICVPHCREETLGIFRALSASKALFGGFSLGTLPPPTVRASVNAPLPKKIFKKALTVLENPAKIAQKAWQFAFNKAPPALLGLRAYDFFLASGTDSVNGFKLIGPETKLLWAHSFDYERFCEEREKNPGLSSSHIVFLDEYVPFHPDYVFQGISPPVSADEYYPALNKFFEWIETRLGKPVVIAAHPRSHYERHPDFFGGRKVIRGETPKLVREAALVLSHSSTSVCHAVLCKKPILFIALEKFFGRFEGDLTRGLSNVLGKSLVTIDVDPLSNVDLARLMIVEDRAYADYVARYLKIPESFDEPIWEMLRKHL